MKIKFLTTNNLLKAVITDAIFYFNKQKLNKSKTLTKNIKTQGNDSSKSVKRIGKSSNSYIEKSVIFKHKGLAYAQLVNEASMLSFLGKKLKNSSISVPKVNKFIDKKNNVSIQIEYIKGKQLARTTPNFQIKTLLMCLNELKSVSESLSKTEIEKLPKRSNFFIGLTFPVYLVAAYIKNPSDFFGFTKLAYRFYQNFLTTMFGATNYTLTHKDLTGENILVNESNISIIDPEVMVLADPQTDIATMVRYYSQSLSYSRLKSLVEKTIFTKDQKKKFLALSIFYSLQMLTIEKKNSRFYTEALQFITGDLNLYLRDFASQKFSLGSHAISVALKFVGLLNRTLKHESKNSFIVCYHSIEDDSWEFSTKVKDFKDQIAYLVKNYKIVPLNELTANPECGKVALTFDDGYKNLLKNALPVLRRGKLPATFFVLETPLNPNRSELNNEKELLTVDDVKQLSLEGFEIGYHTSTHSDLFKLSGEQLQEEIINGKKRLEKSLGIALNHFAYPRGHYSSKILRFVKKAGFKFSYTVDGGPISLRNPHLIPRYSVSGYSSISEFEASVSDLGLFTEKLYMQALKVKDRLLNNYAK